MSTPSPSPTSHSVGHSTINPATLIIDPRMRRDSPSVRDHIDDLTESIRTHGLIQPIVIYFDDVGQPHLVAGWCRTQACLKLQLPEIPYVLRSNLPPDVAKALELEENLRRRDMTWQENILGIYETHQLKVKLAASDLQSWGQRQTGAILGIKAAQVNTAIVLTKEMLAGNKAVLEAGSIDEAQKALLAQKQDILTAALAQKAGVKLSVSSATKITKGKASGPTGKPTSLSTDGLEPDTTPDISIDPAIFGDLLPSRSKSEQHGQTGKQVHTIELSKMLFNVDCHEWFDQREPESVDLIYTDIPYGIDMSNLEEVDGVADVVAHAHDVEENVSQMQSFLTGAFKVLKPDSYLLFWYDLKHHEKLYVWGTEAGFKVQEWPVVWLKTHTCRNMAAQYNWTKATEYVMVCRKGTPTLKKAQAKNYIAANGMAEKKLQRNPFSKPFEFSKELLDPVVLPGMTMLDCYAGGGSLLRAGINMGLKVIGLEKDPKQFPALQESIKQTYKGMLRGEIEFV